MTSNHHALYVLGYTRATMVGTKRSEMVTSSKSQKTDPSSDCTLQLEYMKSELLVIMDQAGTASKARSVILSLPVTSTAGLRLLEDEEPEAGLEE